MPGTNAGPGPDLGLRDLPERHRYELLVDGHVAGHEGYRREGDSIVLAHTVIEDAYQGRGLAAALARALFAELRGSDLRVVVECPYLKKFLSKNPGEADGMVLVLADD